MSRYKSSKRSLLIAALIILLCLVSLTGATMALFTIQASNGTIGVITTAGKIKVDIVDPSDEKTSLKGQTLQFQTNANQKEIWFEPGATFYTQGFKIKNTGDIPINIRLSVSNDEKLDMEEFNRAFEVWIATSQTDKSNAVKITDFIGRLEVGECSTATYYLYIKMKESAGNEFRGKTYTGIGITVYAVQGNVNVNVEE